MIEYFGEINNYKKDFLKMIKALIFDLDGTVADTIYAINEGINLMLSELGYPPIGYSDVLSFVNFGARGYVEGALPKYAPHDEEYIDRALEIYNQKYALTYMHTDRCYDGIPEALEKLSESFRMGMLSNKQDEFVSRLTEQLFRPHLFEIAHGVRDGIPPKPDPQAPLEMAVFFGLRPDEIAFVGDSDIDVLAALNAGMVAVDVSWGYRDEATLRKCGAQYIAHTPSELVDILMSLK